jgi:GNAT superfamily N-acetyltransferase
MPPDARIEISTDAGRLDIDMIHGYLTTSYWGAGRTRESVERSLRHSLCFGAYRDGRQIGFGRVITDHTSFGWVADVFVLPEFQRQGVGKTLMRAMIEHPELQGTTLMLRTRDAHGLYRQYGFEEMPRPEESMWRLRRKEPS